MRLTASLIYLLVTKTNFHFFKKNAIPSDPIWHTISPTYYFKLKLETLEICRKNNEFKNDKNCNKLFIYSEMMFEFYMNILLFSCDNQKCNFYELFDKYEKTLFE